MSSICKFYRPSKGVITLNGKDIWDIPNAEYYKYIGAVFQDFTNFAFTIAENITMSENADAEKADDAFSKVGLTECVNNLPKGSDTFLSKLFNTDGIDLSGGQEQKLAMARAVYKNAPIFILDEPTASLDPKAESEIYESFFYATEKKTVIFISHRLAVSTLADKIAVFKAGTITEYGTHKELLLASGSYAEMFQIQKNSYIAG